LANASSIDHDAAILQAYKVLNPSGIFEFYFALN